MEAIIRTNDKNLFEALLVFLKSLHIQVIEHKTATDDISSEWYNAAQQNLAKAYSDEDPEYFINMIKEPNPVYEGK